MAKLVRLHTDYIIYSNKMQNLFDEANSNEISVNEAQNRYSELFEDNAKKATEISSLFGKINKKLDRKASAISDKYLDDIYNPKTESNGENRN